MAQQPPLGPEAEAFHEPACRPLVKSQDEPTQLVPAAAAPIERITQPTFEEDELEDTPCCGSYNPWLCKPKQCRQWFTFVLFWIGILGLIGFLIGFCFPKLIDNVITPMIDAMEKHLSGPQIAVIVVLGVVLLPIFLLPPQPFQWLAALAFSMWVALLLVVLATTIGMVATYFVVSRFLRQKALRVLSKNKTARAILNAVNKAGAFKVCFVFRLGPSPYGLENYVLPIPECMRFWPFLFGSILGQMPANVCAVYFGQNVKGMAALLKGEYVPVSQVLYNVLGLVLALCLFIGGLWYAKRALKDIDKAKENKQTSTVEAQVHPEDQPDDERMQEPASPDNVVAFHSHGPSTKERPQIPSLDSMRLQQVLSMRDNTEQCMEGPPLRVATKVAPGALARNNSESAPVTPSRVSLSMQSQRTPQSGIRSGVGDLSPRLLSSRPSPGHDRTYSIGSDFGLPCTPAGHVCGPPSSDYLNEDTCIEAWTAHESRPSPLSKPQAHSDEIVYLSPPSAAPMSRQGSMNGMLPPRPSSRSASPFRRDPSSSFSTSTQQSPMSTSIRRFTLDDATGLPSSAGQASRLQHNSSSRTNVNELVAADMQVEEV